MTVLTDGMSSITLRGPAPPRSETGLDAKAYAAAFPPMACVAELRLQPTPSMTAVDARTVLPLQAVRKAKSSTAVHVQPSAEFWASGVPGRPGVRLQAAPVAQDNLFSLLSNVRDH